MRMSLRSAQFRSTYFYPGVAILAVIIVGVVLLNQQGRLWWCACGQIRLWTSAVWSAENSQQLFDPYSFTHVLHGLIFCGLTAWLFPHVALGWQLWIALVIETFWEVIENSELIIQRYRETTAALGYQGDTIFNSIGDILACGLGFALARYLGFRASLIVFIVVEACLILWIRDSLILNVIMLIYPIDAIKTWQTGQ